MAEKYLLKPEDLGRPCVLDEFDFETTAELKEYDGIIGQDRAIEAMSYGLKIDTRGYNIFMSGMSGTGKTSYAKKYITRISKTKKIPEDWVYVYNFKKPNQPIAINLPAGRGRDFQKDMDEFVKVLKQELKKAFESEDYENEKNYIIQEYQTKRSEMLDLLNEDAEKQGFKVKTTNAGIYFLPVIDGKVISEEEYTELEDTLKNEISKKSEELQMQTMEIIRKVKNLEKMSEEKIDEWENKIALFAVGIHINDIKEKYTENEKISIYLEEVQMDILENLDDFRSEDHSDEQQQVLLPMLKKDDDDSLVRYKVNLFIDNSDLTGAPVVLDYNPNYYNLLGKMEYENEFGSMTTDFTMIKSGLLHQCNGGYLILQAKDVLTSPQSWEALKKVIRTREITIGNLKEQIGVVAGSSMRPEPIPFKAKVVLVGSERLYQILYGYEDDFRKLFKIRVDFDSEMERDKDNVYSVAKFIGTFCRKNEKLHLKKCAVGKVIEYCSRIVENKNRMTTQFSSLVDILSESCAWAEIDNKKYVGIEDVKKAIRERERRSGRYDEKLQELIDEGTIMIDTTGEKTGQINGLSILDVGDYTFGKPTRITATTFIGEEGIVNIEREIEMSGSSHSKGVLILSGYLGQTFAQSFPLSLSASVCFEQQYSGVDGDSASSTELYAILSSLSGIPIKQNIAVTGSVNQKGEIQPIGGAIRKIEGYFEICERKGLTGDQGVIIPIQNVKNLVLKEEVINAVKEGKFHIYAVKTIDEGIEILTGKKAGKRNEKGEFPKDSVNYLVEEKLKSFAKIGATYGKDE
jgi:predicted ATP-dependent protease